MTAEPREELISAYLDDELSATERAGVEKWLAESAEHRQLLEELRALRASLQTLPRHQLDRDLGSAVLRRAERSVLSGAKVTAAAPVSEPAGGLRQWWAQGGKRRILWPVAALAAALLIALFDTQREPPERAVAHRDTAQHAPRGESQISALRSSSTAKETASPNETDFDRVGALKDEPAAAPATAFSASADATAEKAAEMLLKKKNELALAEPVDLVVCDVDLEFIQAQQLERVLKSNRVSFKRLGAEARQRDVQSRSREQQKQAFGVQELYQVNAAPEQVRQIITDLKQERGQVSNVAVTNSIEAHVDAPNGVERDAKTASPAAPAQNKSYGRNQVAEKRRAMNENDSSPPVVTFWLRVADGKQPNPAAATPADKP